jgi:uncharacterized membrane protein
MFELLFKYPPTAFERGEILPLTAFGVATALAVSLAAGALLIWTLRRHRRYLRAPKLAAVGVLQAGVLSIALFMLFQPVLEITQLRAENNTVLMLIDTSRSMALSDDGIATRLQHALPILDKGLIARLKQRFDVRLYTFSDTVLPLDDPSRLPAPGNRTLLESALPDVLAMSRNLAVGGVIVVSDGADNSRAIDARWYAELKQYGIPVDTIGIGAEVPPDDIELSLVDLPQRTSPNINLSATVEVRASRAGPATLKVYDRDRILAAKTIQLDGGGALARHSLSVPTGDVGVRHLRFVVESELDERNPVNNQQRRALTVAAREPRILYLEGEPRWEYKFIRRAVEGENLLALHTLLQTSPNNYYRQGIQSPEQLLSGFPNDRAELFGYDALIIGSQDAAGLSREQHDLIKSFVAERGGTLLMLGGRRGLADGDWHNTSVADALPAKLSTGSSPTFKRDPVPVRPTAAGLRTVWLRFAEQDANNDETWAKLPGIADYQLVGEPKPGATTLIEAEPKSGATPLLMTQRYGKGRSFILASGGTWRWQMQLPSEDRTHETFWRQLLQELVREAPPQIEFSTDRNWYTDEGGIELKARVFDAEFHARDGADVEVEITREDGSHEIVKLGSSTEQAGTYLGSARIDAPGAVQLDMRARQGDTELGGVRLFAERDDGVTEYFRAGQNRALLERIAAETGGRYYSLDNVAELPERIRYSSSGITERQRLPLWSMPINFLLLFGFKAAEWLLRRQWGHL